MNVRVLLVGKGAREHALAWKFRASPLLTKLYLWPGNPAMEALGEPIDLAPTADFESLAQVASRLAIDLVVSGPEAPLSEGLSDTLKRHGIPVFGPERAAAQLESSKEFAKAVMSRAGIPTAAYVNVRTEADCRREALAMLSAKGGVVLKASGLAAGKGVFVCATAGDVENGLNHLYHTDMSAASGTVVLEEVLAGRECSYFTCIGVGGATGLGFAVDFKRLEDDDQGPNTGGMGCYAPAAWLPSDAEAQVIERVVDPLLAQFKKDGLPYCGWLYVGLMWHPVKGPQVIEFNVRLGDPEAQVLAVYDERDWLPVVAAKAGLDVPADALRRATTPLAHGERAVCVVMASQSYPYGKDAGQVGELPAGAFAGPADPQGKASAKVFAASVKKGSTPNQIATAAGRVLSVVARGPSFAAARERAYLKVQEIGHGWKGARFRADIAQRVAQEVDVP